MKTVYNFTNDPGHGWLHVKRKELERLGIEKDITPWSYQRGETVYLEEDCDASIFIKAKEARGEKVEFKESYYDNPAPVRSYESYRP